MSDPIFSVEEVSNRLGITPRTLHYYEEIGLIPEVPRTDGGHRFYNQSAVDQIGHIIRIKNLMGISLQEISRILDAERNLEEIKEQYYKQDSGGQKMKLLEQCAELLQQMADTIDDKINNLQALRDGCITRLNNVNRKREHNSSNQGDGLSNG